MKKLLLLLMTVCMLLTLVACGSNGGKRTETTRKDTNTQTPSNSEKDPDALFQTINDDLPELNYDNAEIKVVLRSEDRYSSEFVVDESDSNVVSVAIYQRNLHVEDRLGVAIAYHPLGNGHGPWTDIENNIMTGVCEFDVVVGSSSPASAQFQKGLYKNLRNVEYLDLTKEYWSQGMIDNQTIAGATYGATGSISTYFFDSAFVVYFNRNLCEAHSIAPDSVYDTVLSGNWTLEEMMMLTKDVWVDDGDGVPSENDVYGFGLQVTSAIDGFTSSCHVDYLAENDDSFEIAMDLAKVNDIVTKLNDFLWGNNGVCGVVESTNYVANDLYLLDQQFANDKLLFVTDWLYSTSTLTMRDMASDFGVLPYPKYTADQEYSTYVHDKYSLFAIPVSVSAGRVDMIGAFLEAMASEGHNNVMPAYYEKALTGRYIRDPESVQTMDIIVRNISIDKLWSLDNRIPRFTMRQLVWNKSTNVVSTYREYYDLSKGTIADIYAKYAEFAGN